MADRELKNGWHMWRFDQMAVNVNDRIDDPSKSGVERYVGLEHLDPDSLRIRRWGSPSDVEATKLIFRTGDIIFARRRAYQRKLGVADFDGICSAHAMVLRAKPEVVLPEFLPFFMQSNLFMDRAVEISVGSLSPTINWKTLAQQQFALPPLGVQGQLALALNSFQVAQSELAFAKDSSEVLETSLLMHIMTPAPHWEKVLLRDVAQIDIEKVKVESQKSYRLAGVLAYGQGLFDNGQASRDTTSYAYLHRLHVDQLVLRKITAWESPIAIVTMDFDGAFASPEFPTFTLNASRIKPAYMSLLYKTPEFRQEMRARCIGTLVRRMRLYPEALLAIPIALPPIDEQEELVGQMRAIYDGRTMLAQRHSAVAETKNALLASVWHGTPQVSVQ